MKKYSHYAMGLLILIIFCGGFLKARQYHPAVAFQVSFYPTLSAQVPQFKSDFVSSKLYTQTHAASLVQLKDGRLRAFWFAGSREGASDVQIRSAVFEPATNSWSAEQVVATRQDTEKSVLRYVSKLGNPVCGRAPDGKLWLFYVTVSLGGWSGSSITMKTSSDEGKTWGAARRLVTSPILNVSTLVKGTPFFYSDGTMGLPVYRELNNKFGEILHFDKNGKVIDLQRLSAARDDGLQPVMLVETVDRAQVLMRNGGSAHSRRVISATTQDGGQQWTKPTGLSLPNPDSAVSAVMLADHRILAVVNNETRQGISKGRDALSLMISADSGKSWKLVYQLEDQSAARTKPLNQTQYLKVAGKLAMQSDDSVTQKNVAEYAQSAKDAMCSGDSCGFEFSYPYLIQSENGDFQLVYTWNRGFIKHVTFNQAWVDQRLNQ